MGLGFVLTMALLVNRQPGAESPQIFMRIRTIEPIVRELIRKGQRRSATFAELVDRIERSETFVYVVRAHTLPHGIEGCLVLEGSSSVARYLKVLIAMRTSGDRLIMVLAHEFQHVREVLEAGVAIHWDALAALFERIGARQLGSNTGEQYETAAATQVMATVERELRASAR